VYGVLGSIIGTFGLMQQGTILMGIMFNKIYVVGILFNHSENFFNRPCSSALNTVEPGYNDIGLYDTSPIESDNLW
jgi:hypothetical protein